MVQETALLFALQEMNIPIILLPPTEIQEVSCMIWSLSCYAWLNNLQREVIVYEQKAN